VKYLLMIAGDESAAAHANDGCGGWTEEMEARGVLAGGAGLRPPDEATTVRVRDREVLLTDGPFAETKEQLGGYYVIDARDLNEAIRVAAKIPGARIGSVEVRPIADDE
jgi:hypothetical protein